MPAKHGMIATAVALVIALFAVRGCASSSIGGGNMPASLLDGGDASAPDAMADAAVSFDASDDASQEAVEAAPTPCADASAVGVPGGWVGWDGYDPSCGFCVPPTPDLLPKPIRWTPCDPAAQPSGISCGQMLADWPPDTTSSRIGWINSSVPSYSHPSRGLILQVTRVSQDVALSLIGAADGPVTQAVLQTNWRQCTLGSSSLNSGKYAYRVYENQMTVGGGVLAGSADDLQPTALLHLPPPPGRFSHPVVAGRPGVLDTTTMLLYAIGSPTPLLNIIDPSDGPIGYYEQVFVGDALLWEASSRSVSRIKIWTADGGARDLVSFGSDTTQGAGDFGSDGHDLVWLYASGRTTPTPDYPTVSIATSAYSTNAQQIVPHRLRSERATGFTASPFFVGCGYAARDNGMGIRVVRLSDGVSWFLSTGTVVPWQWRWEFPVGLTCSELFAIAEERTGDAAGPFSVLARVRLDSLGPGTPPD